MSDFLLQEDGSSRFLLESGTGALLLEGASPPSVGPSFIGSTTTLYAPSVVYTDSATFPNAGTFTWLCPPGITLVEVSNYGGGGGGGSASVVEGGGGGGGAFAGRVAVPVTPGTTYTFTVGSPGTGQIFGGGPVTSGTSSTFTGDSGVQVIAVGGTGGSTSSGGAGGLASACTGDTGLKFDGGTGGAGGGLSGATGGGGASGNPAANGANGQAGGSGGAGGVGTNGGGSGGAGTGGGNPGGLPGGGGAGGAATNGNGQAGGSGQVTITTFATISMSFIASVTTVYEAHTNPGTITPPFIGSVTVVYAPTFPGQVDPPFISSTTTLYAPRVQIAFTGAAVSQVALEVAGNSTTDGDAFVSQVTLEILVPNYDGLHVWEKTGQTGG